ncbi:hypothetical protein CPter291_5258 [Collimonas pratensis]|uniref:Uncharacterized protein n=1 Tax=Collimonas pratensis TaxID=279113 RepID=A0ABN4MK08_9BURK|nr:hypothetical protein CPter291_5258 [Collimonas pratensis]
MLTTITIFIYKSLNIKPKSFFLLKLLLKNKPKNKAKKTIFFENSLFSRIGIGKKSKKNLHGR